MQLRNCPDFARARIHAARVHMKFNCRVLSQSPFYSTNSLNIFVLNFYDKFLVKANSSADFSVQSLKFIHREKILNLVNTTYSDSFRDTRMNFRRTVASSYAVIISPVRMNDNLGPSERWHVTGAFMIIFTTWHSKTKAPFPEDTIFQVLCGPSMFLSEICACSRFFSVTCYTNLVVRRTFSDFFRSL